MAIASRREWCRKEGDIDNSSLTFLLSFLLPDVCGLYMSCVVSVLVPELRDVLS